MVPTMNSNTQDAAIQLNQSELDLVEKALKNWNRGYLAFGGITLLFTGLTLACSFFIYANSNRISSLSQSIADEKDRISAQMIAEADKKGAEAVERAKELDVALQQAKNDAKQIDINLLNEQRLTSVERWRLARVERAVLPRALYVTGLCL